MIISAWATAIRSRPHRIGQVHHGADDNASGTAGVMELARIAAGEQSRLKRSVLFIAFAGEIGLLGSSDFANHPTVPLKGIDAMINMDMIGRVTNNRLFIGGVGTSPSLAKQIVKTSTSPRVSTSIFRILPMDRAITPRSMPRRYRCCSS
jgi:Zn-dependent M28 family amino/carboxypeptidase